MGDKGPEMSPTEKKFLEDLEIATRLSLTEYERENKLRSNGNSGPRKLMSPDSTIGSEDGYRGINIKPRPRPSSRLSNAGLSVNVGGNSPAGGPNPSPVSINPPPSSHILRRNRSLPYRVRGHGHSSSEDGKSANPQSEQEDDATDSKNYSPLPLFNSSGSAQPPSTNDDLILLASPKMTQKFSAQNRIVYHNLCDISPNGYTAKSQSSSPASLNSPNIKTLFSPTNTFSIMPSNQVTSPNPNSANGGINGDRKSYSNGNGISPLVNNPSSLNFPPSIQPNQNPVSPLNGSGILQTPQASSYFNGSASYANGNRNESTPPTLPLPISGCGSAYSNLAAQLKFMSFTDDLIDLGQSDQKNILEYFDPLLYKEKREATTFSDTNSNQRIIPPPSEVKIPGEEKKEDGDSDTCSTVASTRASFTFHGRNSPTFISLYPSLKDFEPENLYPTLELDKDRDDVSSFYDNVFNPLEYLKTVSCSSNSLSSVYEYGTTTLSRPLGFSHFTETVPGKSGTTQNGNVTNPPALPPRNSSVEDSPVTLRNAAFKHATVVSSKQKEDLFKRHGRLYENIEQVKNYAYSDSEIQAFYEMIKELRFSNRHVDSTTNVGYIRSSTLNNKSIEALSIKVVVHNEENISSDPASFTCDVSATPDLIIAQSIIDFDLTGSGRDYMLRVKGINEYLSTEVQLAKYRYIQECIKLDQDIQLVLVSKSSMERNSWARTSKDDADSVGISLEDITPQTPAKTITHKDITIPLEVIDRESERLKEKLSATKSSSRDPANLQLSPASLIQGVKAVCCLLGEVQTVEIIDCLNSFMKICNDWNSKLKVTSPDGENPGRRAKVTEDFNSRKSFVEIVPRQSSVNVELKERVLSALFQLEDAVRHLVEMYSKSFPVSFQMKELATSGRASWSSGCKPMSDMLESFLIRVGAAHRLKPEWISTYTDFILLAEIYHGTRSMAKGATKFVPVTKGDNNVFFPSLIFNSWINFEIMPVCILPRESRVVFSLLGRKPNEENSSKMDMFELGWASVQCFNFKGLLAQGKYLLPFWPVGLVQKKMGPAPDSSFSSDKNSSLLTIEFMDFGYDIPFPDVPSVVLSKRDFNSLDPSTQILLKEIYENSTFTKFPPEVREVLWEKRHYLHEFPNALPKVLLAAQLWDFASLGELHAMLQCWETPEPIDALQLLLPCFPDIKVREQGVNWVSKMPDEELINLLPQLVEALSFETFDFSPLARLLLRKALSCLKICHYLFWLLVSAVGLGKWATEFAECSIISRITLPETQNSYDPKRRRLELMLNSLMVICGGKWKTALVSQYRLMESFYDVAVQVKAASGSARQNVLSQELNKVQNFIFNSCNEIPLPLSPSYDVQSIDIKSCSYFTSASVPLKICFNSGLPEKNQIATIYKVGDDLRQDMLTIQIIRVVEKWWLESGLELRVLTFSCIPTGNRQGFVEMVPNAETLCRIQAEHGLTGAFRNRPIAEWLAKMNPSTLDYRRAVENFTMSCAAYCVVTYILGICDRHNDNIMLTKKGHLFHIDFGKFLGDAQMFGNIIKRDRTPFVLTADMVYVINDGEKDSSKFHRFVELCCEAFRIVRQNGNTLVNLFALMATAGISGVDSNSAMYVQNALLPECSNYEASARFASFIQESLQNWFTPVNFFLHTLAQLPFGSDTTDDPTKLSFVPTTYTLENDGRIERAEVISCVKKYDPEKFYLYTVKLKRKGQTEWSMVHRLYKEFLELHAKLCLNFPKAAGNLRTLPRGSGLSRSNVKQVSEKRKVLLQMFIEALFTQADEIAHSALVYTFFHPLLRDEEEHQEEEIERRNSAITSLARNPSRIYGQIKLSIVYTRSALHVLVQHVVDLACPNGTAPSPYVKTYLQPDPGRKTKRKTKVVKKSQHPTFMEMIEYRLPLEVIRQRTLAVSVWHYDPFQENNFLGGVTVQLSSLTMGKETTETYTLVNLLSSS